jgi:hypothetical protein
MIGGGRRNGSAVDPYGGIPKELRPDLVHLLMAAAIHAQQQQGKFRPQLRPVEVDDGTA